MITHAVEHDACMDTGVRTEETRSGNPATRNSFKFSKTLIKWHGNRTPESARSEPRSSHCTSCNLRRTLSRKQKAAPETSAGQIGAKGDFRVGDKP